MAKVLTSSSLSDFRTCPRLYFYKFEAKRVPVTASAALQFGKVWHSVMERWWLDGMPSVVAWLAENNERIGAEDSAKITALLSCYAPPRDHLKVLAVEQPFEVRIDNPDGGRAFYGYRLAGKLDLIIEDVRNGALWVCDHKTTSSEIIGYGQYWQALQIDGQMQNYCLAIPTLYGKDAAGFIYDVARKPGIKLCATDEKMAAAKGISAAEAYQLRCEVGIRASTVEYFQWREHTKTDADMAEARRDLWQQVEMFRSCANAGRFPRNCNSCVGRYGRCPYLGVCSGTERLDDDAAFRSKDVAHEELIEA